MTCKSIFLNLPELFLVDVTLDRDRLMPLFFHRTHRTRAFVDGSVNCY